ncbi:MAG: hypothetical protein OXD01_14505, partial [Gammaproteobacteria bacterium]|nr:hypothetical protein [Gammaproteobacteria bacterium]
MRLTAEPSGNVTVTVSEQGTKFLDLDGNKDNGPDTISLTFTQANWDEYQNISAGTPPDPVSNKADDTTDLLFSASGGGYDSVTATMPVTIFDSSNQIVSLEFPTNSTIDEGNSVEFNVSIRWLHTMKDKNLRIPFSISGDNVNNSDFEIILKKGVKRACDNFVTLNSLGSSDYPDYSESAFTPSIPRDQWFVLTYTWDPFRDGPNGSTPAKTCTLVLSALQNDPTEMTETFEVKLAPDNNSASQNGFDHLNEFPVNVHPAKNIGSVMVENVPLLLPANSEGTFNTNTGGGTQISGGEQSTRTPLTRDMIKGFAAETENGQEHVDRWLRVLAAIGEDNGQTPMTAA